MRKLAAALLIFLPAAVSAQPAATQVRGSVYLTPMGEPFVAPSTQAALALWMATVDRDRNGAVTLAELKLDADRFFKRLDADADGRIGGIEMTRYEEQIAPPALRYAAGIRPVGSDRPIRPEGRAPGDFSGQAAPREGRAGLPGGMSGPMPSMIGALVDSMMPGANLASVPQPVAMTDTDMSGSVTPDEFDRAATRRFATLDQDKNGQVDATELLRNKP